MAILATCQFLTFLSRRSGTLSVFGFWAIFEGLAFVISFHACITKYACEHDRYDAHGWIDGLMCCLVDLANFVASHTFRKKQQEVAAGRLGSRIQDDRPLSCSSCGSNTVCWIQAVPRSF